MAPAPKREVFAWECNVRGKDWQRTINHLTAGKARYKYLLDLLDLRQVQRLSVELPHKRNRILVALHNGKRHFVTPLAS